MASLKWLWQTFVGALGLRDSTFEDLRDAPDGMRRGLWFLVALALVVGLVAGAVAFVQDATTDPIAAMDKAETGIRQAFERMDKMGVFGEDADMQLILDNIEAGIGMGKGIVGVVEDTTPAPMTAVYLLQAVGKWLSRPFSWIALWLFWGMLTLLFARLLGGTATIQRMLATTSLVAAPHVLEAFGWVPCAGPAIALVTLLWGLAIYVKGTAVANRIGMGAALLAVLLPVIVAAVIGIVLLLMLGTLIALAD